MEGLPPVQLSELRERIITDEITDYPDTQGLKTIVTKLLKETIDCVEQFSEVLLPLVDELLKLSGDHMLTMYKSMVIDFIQKKPKVIIDNLILKCYDEKDGVLRAKIVSGDESFFMNNNFEDMTEGDSSIINIIFKTKDFWGKLTEDNKEVLKSYLLSLVSLCDVRYVNYKKYLCLKKLNPSHTNFFNDTDKLF
jgi:hypothetical protein